MKKNTIKRWILLSFTGILLLSVAMSAVVNYQEAYNGAMWESEDKAQILSDIVRQLLKHDWKLDELSRSAEDADNEEARQVFSSLCKRFRLDYLSIYRIDPEPPYREYYIYVSSESRENSRLQRSAALPKDPEDALTPGEQALLDGSREMEQEITQTPRGLDVTWLAPYEDADGNLAAVIGMDFDLMQIRRNTISDFLVDIIPFTLSLMLGLLILLFLVHHRIAVPLAALSDEMKLFARNSRQRPKPLNIRLQDEIGEIAASFEKMTEDISDYVNNIEKLTQEQTEINTQLELARKIQYDLVPESTELSGGGFCLNALTRPAKAVGGDFYDCFRLDEDSVCVVMGDVSGKGISAAICMSMVRTVIREKLMAGLSPAGTLNRTNDQLCAHNTENLFVTVFAAVLNTRTGELRYSNAGHTWPVLLKDEPSFLVPDSGIALGMFEDAGLKDYTLTLPPHEGILLYTDGVTEAVDPDRRFFGTERLLDALKGLPARENQAEEAVLCVSRAVSAFCNGSEPFDDMAVLALYFTPASPASSASPASPASPGWNPLPVSLSAFEEIKKIVFAAAGETPEARRALLACDETLTNVVNYSGATELAFFCEVREDTICTSFSDNGIPFDPTAAAAEEKDFELLDSGGMGLNLIRQSASSLHYERKDDRNVFTLYFPLKAEGT